LARDASGCGFERRIVNYDHKEFYSTALWMGVRVTATFDSTESSELHNLLKEEEEEKKVKFGYG